MTQEQASLLIDARVYERVIEYAHRAGLTPEEVLSQTMDALAQHIEGLTPETHDYVRMRALCEAMGYTDYRVFPSGRNACIKRLGYATAILADITPDGGGELWCYAAAAHACEALAAWDGAAKSEPQGWRHHPITGRKRPDGDAAKEYIEP